jgi:transcriptional regulator with XRE-family HTH domain
MKLRERRLDIGKKQTEIVTAIKKRDRRMDIGLYSKLENGYCLPTPKQMQAITSTLNCEVLDIYNREDLLLIPRKIKVTEHKDTYKITVIVDKKYKDIMNKKVLKEFDYASITHFFRSCIAKLAKKYRKFEV